MAGSMTIPQGQLTTANLLWPACHDELALRQLAVAKLPWATHHGAKVTLISKDAKGGTK